MPIYDERQTQHTHNTHHKQHLSLDGTRSVQSLLVSGLLAICVRILPLFYVWLAYYYYRVKPGSDLSESYSAWLAYQSGSVESLKLCDYWVVECVYRSLHNSMLRVDLTCGRERVKSRKGWKWVYGWNGITYYQKKEQGAKLGKLCMHSFMVSIIRNQFKVTNFLRGYEKKIHARMLSKT